LHALLLRRLRLLLCKVLLGLLLLHQLLLLHLLRLHLLLLLLLLLLRLLVLILLTVWTQSLVHHVLLALPPSRCGRTRCLLPKGITVWRTSCLRPVNE